MKYRHTQYLFKLIYFAFLPVWLLTIGLTYLSAHEIERQRFFLAAFYLTVLMGSVTLIAPMVKVWLLTGERDNSWVLLPRTLVAVTLAEVVVLLISMVAAIWFISVGGPITRLDFAVPVPLAILVVFMATCSILGLVLNLTFIGGNVQKLSVTCRQPKNLALAGLLALIAPSMAVAVVSAVNLLNLPFGTMPYR